MKTKETISSSYLGQFYFMKHEVNIAIFGLSLSVLDELKNKIRLMLPSNIQINWTNIAEPNLDCIMINDVFFTSSNIQNLIQNKQLNYLRLVKDENRGGSIEGDVLYIPLNNASALNQWIERHVLGKGNATSVGSSSTASTFGQQSIQARQAQVLQQSSFATSNAQQTQTKVSSKILNEIFDAKNGNIQLFDASGKIAIAQASTERIWLLNHKKSTDGSLNYTYATSQDVKDCQFAPVSDLRLWMFNLAWNSHQALNFEVSTQKYYKLLFWPQAVAGQDRKDIIRISSCFAKGANIEQVANHLKISHSLIERYISSCLASHLITEIPVEQAKLVKFAVPEQQATPQQVEQASAVKSFFGRLRKRLGL